VTPRRQVRLRNIAGDDHLRIEAETGQKHLHLLRRGVLRLIEDHTRIVECPSTHISERSNLDSSPLDERSSLFGAEHVPQRVVKRTQIRVDLGGHVAGEKPEPLPRLNRRSGEDDASDYSVEQTVHGGGHGQIRLAGASRADSECQSVFSDGLDIFLLAVSLWPDHSTPTHRDPVAQDSGGTGDLVSRHFHDFDDPTLIQGMAFLDQDQQLIEDRSSCLDVLFGAPQDDLIPARDKPDLRKERLDLAEMPIGLTYEIQHQVMAGDTQTRFALVSRQGDDAVVEASEAFYRLFDIQLVRSLRGGNCLHRLGKCAKYCLVSSAYLGVAWILAQQLDRSEVSLHQIA
jgi:hypothetical protein